MKRLYDKLLENFERQLESGENAKRTYNDYKSIAKLIRQQFDESRFVELLKSMVFADYRAMYSSGRETKTFLNFVIGNNVVFNFVRDAAKAA